MRLKLLLLLLLPLNAFSLSASAQEDTTTQYIDLEMVFHSYFHLEKLVINKPRFRCTMWTLNDFTLMDTSLNVIETKRVWAKGVRRIGTKSIIFEQIKGAPVYYLKYYKNHREQIIDTIRLKKVRSQKIDFEPYQSETNALDKSITLVEQMVAGDTMVIQYNEYGCNYTKGVFKIICHGDYFAASLKEYHRTGRPLKHVLSTSFSKDKIYEKHIEMIKAFEYDSRRVFYSGCNDMDHSYLIQLNDDRKTVRDGCGSWGAYELLKMGLFWD